jgi:hypothetical protein
MVIDLLDKLHESGDLKALFKAGVISPSVIQWRKIYHTYKGQIENGRTKTQAVNETSDVHDCSVDQVYRVIRRMICTN